VGDPAAISGLGALDGAMSVRGNEFKVG